MERTALSEWMLENGYSTSKFRDLVQEKMGIKRLSIYTVDAWRAGERTPNPKAMAVIMELTGLTEQALAAREKTNG